MGKGESSHVSFAENLVTSHEIVDRNAIAIKTLQVSPEIIKTPLVPDKLDKKKVLSG
jgi:hypothetical protein